MSENKFQAASVTLVIPAFNPTNSLVSLVNSLDKEGFEKIIVVNDGSSKSCDSIFAELKLVESATIIDIPVNQGKGAALKSAFNHILQLRDPQLKSLVTADADGQHSMRDIVNIAQHSVSGGDSIVLGTRSFGRGIPLRSFLGNEITKWIFFLITGSRLQDTQTGLRGFPVSHLEDLVQINADRYEYELEVLLNANKRGISLIEVPIETIYIDDNASSHFNPILDSIKIYSVFFRYICSSLISFVVDIVFFVIFRLVFQDIIISSYCARLVSGATNFSLNKFMVFHSKAKKQTAKELMWYIFLAVIIIIVSTFLVAEIAKVAPEHVIIIKVCVDLSMFIFNFWIQRVFIFVSKATRR